MTDIEKLRMLSERVRLGVVCDDDAAADLLDRAADALEREEAARGAGPLTGLWPTWTGCGSTPWRVTARFDAPLPLSPEASCADARVALARRLRATAQALEADDAGA